MAGNRDGGKKAAATNKAKHKTPRWFQAHPELAKKAGSIGGKRSSRKGIKNGMGKSRYKYWKTNHEAMLKLKEEE